MVWRVGVALSCVAGLVALFGADPSADDDPWVTVAIIGLPLAGGLLIGRVWALGIALTPLLLYALDPDTGELVAWYAVTVPIVVFTVSVATGLALRRGIDRLRSPSRAGASSSSRRSGHF